MSVSDPVRQNIGSFARERRSELEIDAVMLKGALSREINFQTQLQDQLLLQDYLRFRKLTQESCQAPMTPPESAKIGPIQRGRTSQLNLNPGTHGNSQISPLNQGFSEATQTQHHKNSAATSKMTTLTTTNLQNTINYVSNSKSTASQTPQTQSNPRPQGQDSGRILSAFKPEEEDIRIFRQSPEANEDNPENIGQITLSFQKTRSQPGYISQPPSLMISTSKIRNQNDSSYNLAAGAISQMPLMSQGPGESLYFPMSQSNMEENIHRGSKELEMEDLNLESRVEPSRFDPSKSRKESGIVIQSSNFNTNQKKSRFSGIVGGGGSPLIRSVMPLDFFRHINVMKFVHTFMNKLSSYTLHANFVKLTQIHFDLIGDISAFYSPVSINEEDSISGRKRSGFSLNSGDNSLSRKMQSLLQPKPKKFSIKPLMKRASKILKLIPIFDPNSFLFIIWDIVMLLIQFMVCIMVPFGVSFQVDWNFLGQSTFNIMNMMLIFFLIDIVITLNRGIYVSGIAVLDRKTIVKKYAKEILFADIITIISLANIDTYTSLLILVRLWYIGIIIARLDDHFQVRMRFSHVSQMFFMVGKIVIIAHFCACGLYLVSRLSMEVANETESLLTQTNFKKGDWSDKYINCLYFTLITMSTVGYGDITPKNNYEKSYVMVMTMLSSAIFGYVVNTVGSIFLNIAQRRASFEQKKFDITNYMNIRNIPKQIQMKTIKFLEYTQLEKNDTHLKGELIIESLPLQLSGEIKQEFYGKILHGSKLLSTNFSTAAINSIALKMKEIQLAPGQFLFQQGQKDNKLFFLLEGNLSVMIKGNNEVLTKVATIEHKGTMIGQRSFFCDQVRSKWIKCEKSSNLAFIEFSELKEILLHFPQDYEMFCKMKDTIIFEGKTADTPCASCDQFSHNIQECPLIHLRFNRLKIIYAELYTQPQERQNTVEVHRKIKKKKFLALSDIQIVRMRLRKIRVDKIKEQLSKSAKGQDISLAETASFNVNFQEEILTYEALEDTEKDMKFFKGVPEIIFDSVDSLDDGQLLGDMMGINLSEKYENSDNDESDDKLEYSDEDSQETVKLGANPESDAPTVEKQAPISHQQQQSQPVQELMDNLTVAPLNPSSQNAGDRNSFSSSNVLSGTSSKTEHGNHLAGGQQKTSLLARNVAQLEENYNTTEAKKFIPLPNLSFNGNIREKEDSQTAQRLNSQSSIQSSKHERQPTLTLHRQTSMQSIQPYASAMNPLIKDSQNSNSNILSNQAQFTNEQIIKIINSALLSQQPSQQGSNVNQQQSVFGGTMTSRRRSIQFAKVTRPQLKQKSTTIIEKQKTHLVNSGMQNILIDQQSENLHKQKMYELYFYDFEQPKKMIKYFPKFNLLNVVANFNKIQKLKNFKKSKNENNLTLGGGSQGQLSPERSAVRIVSPTRRRKDRKSSHSINLFARQLNQRDSILISN